MSYLQQVRVVNSTISVEYLITAVNIGEVATYSSLLLLVTIPLF